MSSNKDAIVQVAQVLSHLVSGRPDMAIPACHAGLTRATVAKISTLGASV